MLLATFAMLVVATGLVVALVARSRTLDMTLTRLQDTTAEIRVRAAVVLLVAFVALAERFGLESILGAFMAGAVVGILDRDTTSHPHFRLKLEAIGYGFLIPVFFVTSGIRLDLTGLLDDPGALARVPVFVVALLVVRGVPALLFAKTFDRSALIAAGLLQATSLPFIVTATQIGVLTGLMTPGDGSRDGVRRPGERAAVPRRCPCEAAARPRIRRAGHARPRLNRIVGDDPVSPLGFLA